MNHPDHSQWMSYLYDELESGRRTELAGHLQQCDDCRRRLDSWIMTKQDLNRWTLPPTRHAAVRMGSRLKWGAAALFLIGLGFGVGRFSSPLPDLTAIRVQLEPRLRAGLQEEIKITFNAERREWISLLNELEKQQVTDYASLRKDLETVAIMADAGFQSTQRDLGQIAAFTQTSFNQNQ